MIGNKRGEKELQMIFGLFILLIITLVVLNLFLQTAKQGGSKVQTVQQQQLQEQALQRMKLNCEALCNNIVDENTAIEYCAKFETLDADNNNNKLAQKARFGKYEFCTSKVPCFLISENCQNGLYTAQTCKQLLLGNPATYDLYNTLRQDANSKIPKVSADDGCKLEVTDKNKNNSNWKLVFGFMDPSP